MQRNKNLILCFALAAAVGLATASAPAAADGWKAYMTADYGFSMTVPAGAKVVERERLGGWGGLYVKHDGVELYGLAKLGEKASPDAIAKVAVKVSGIPDSAWKVVTQGRGENGFKWYKMYRAARGSKVVYGVSGVGPKGSYLLFLRTTAGDFEAHAAEYARWVETIRVF